MNKELHKEISRVLDECCIDPHYEEFAEAVAKVLIEDYGTHNFEPFMAYLKNRLEEK